jgi:hypothetical protein
VGGKPFGYASLRDEIGKLYLTFYTFKLAVIFKK